MNKKILVTGSCGFIFSSFVRRVIYNKLPYTIVSVDKVANKQLNSVYWNKNHAFHIADINDQHILDLIFDYEKPDIVIHGAAETSVDCSLKDPSLFARTNVVGTQNVINSAIKYDVENFVYISTDEVYGHLSSENDSSWKEEVALNPRNPYSASKAAGELLVKAAHQTYGLNYTITRCSNNYGPRQTTNKLIPKIIKSIYDNEKIPIYGQGAQLREWTHVYDNCSAILTILEKGIINNVYNISSNQEFSNIEIVQKICNLMNKGHDLISFIPDPRSGHDFRYSVDSSKIRQLGWSPSLSLKEGLQETIEWYSNNKWFLKQN